MSARVWSALALALTGCLLGATAAPGLTWLDAGELGAGHTVTVLYEIIPAGSKETVPGIDELKYQKTKLTDAANSAEMMTVKLRYKKPTGKKSTLLSQPLVDGETALAKTSNAFRFSAAVVQAALVLRDSKYKGKSSLKGALDLAKGAMGADENGYRFEFTKLVEKAMLLKGNKQIAQ